MFFGAFTFGLYAGFTTVTYFRAGATGEDVEGNGLESYIERHVVVSRWCWELILQMHGDKL